MEHLPKAIALNDLGKVDILLLLLPFAFFQLQILRFIFIKSYG
ncbi:hypothetical protein [Nostoc sp.]